MNDRCNDDPAQNLCSLIKEQLYVYRKTAVDNKDSNPGFVGFHQTCAVEVKERKTKI